MNVFGSHCNRPTHRSRLPIRPVLELVGLWPYRDRRPAGFSFSMKQRLALVIALVNDPEFLILDEPFVDLDPDGVLQLIAVLRQWASDRSIAMLISSCRSCASDSCSSKAAGLRTKTSISRRRDAGDAPGISPASISISLLFARRSHGQHPRFCSSPLVNPVTCLPAIR